MDIQIIEQINQIAKSIQISGEVQHPQKEIQKLECIIKLHHQLSKKRRNEYKYYTYIPHRNLGRLYFMQNRLEEAIDHLEKSRKLFRSVDQIDAFVNVLNSKRMVAHAHLRLGLSKKEPVHIQIARKILDNLSRDMIHIDNTPLKEDIKKDFNLLKGIEQKDIKTVVRFNLPFAIHLSPDHEITFDYEGEKITVATKDQEDSTCCVDVRINRYIDLHTHDVKDKAIRVMNHFIQCYKKVTNSFWMFEYNEKNFLPLEYITLANGQKIFSKYESKSTKWVGKDHIKNLLTELEKKVVLCSEEE